MALNRSLFLCAWAAGLLLALLAAAGYFIVWPWLSSSFSRPEPVVDVPSQPGLEDAADVPIPVMPFLADISDQPVIEVHAFYHGANAKLVADEVASPIEREVDGVENLVDMKSRSLNDGSYTLHVTFKPGTNVEMAQVLVQNRVAIATEKLPRKVRAQGLQVRKKPLQAMFLVVLTSPDDSRDALELSKYVTLQFKDDLTRIAGVGDIMLLGHRSPSVQFFRLDREKLHTYGLTTADVQAGLKKWRSAEFAGNPGLPPKLIDSATVFRLHGLGRLGDKQLEEVVLRTDPDGRLIRLKDVASAEQDITDHDSLAHFNSKPAVVLGIQPLPQTDLLQMRDAVQERLAKLRGQLPEGIGMELGFDFLPAREAGDRPRQACLRVDLVLPDGASMERTRKALERCEAILRSVDGVRDILSVAGSPVVPANNRGYVLLTLSPTNTATDGRERIGETMHKRLQAEMPEALLQVNWAVLSRSSSPASPAP